MKKCTNCGIIVHNDFERCPNCKSITFETIEQLAEKVDANKSISMQSSETGEKDTKRASGNSSEIFVFRILEIIGATLALIGIFLPFIRVSLLGTVLERSFFDLAPEDYILFLVLAGLGIVSGIVGSHVATAVMGSVYGVFLFWDTRNYFAQINSSEYGALVTKGAGFYCMIAGVLLMIVFGITAKCIIRKTDEEDII